MVRIIALVGVIAYANGFSLAPCLSMNNRAASHLCMSEPSDTSSDSYDDFVTVESEPYEPTKEEALVSNVMDLMPDTLGEASAEQRSAINEAIYKLEAMNPTPDPTLSPLLNGVWELRYAGGYSADWALPSPTR